MNRTATFFLAGVGNYYLTTLTIWLGHWSSHFPSSPTYGFHVGGHHSLYPDSKTSLSDKFLYGSGRHDSLFALLPTLLMQAGVLAVLTRGWLRLGLLLEMGDRRRLKFGTCPVSHWPQRAEPIRVVSASATHP